MTKNSARIAIALALLLIALAGGIWAIVTLSSHSARKPRQVVVGPPMSLAALSPATSFVPSPMLTFSNGTTIELLGITDTPGEPSRWWSADGTPMAAPAPLPGKPASLEPGQFPIQVILRKTDPPGAHSDDMMWSVSLDGPHVVATTMVDLERFSTTRPGGQIINEVFQSTDESATANLRVQLGAGPWTETFRVELTGSATTRTMITTTTQTTAPATQPSFTFVSIADNKRGQAELVARFSPAHEKRRGRISEWMVLVDAAGKAHWYEGTRYLKDRTTVFRFSIPRNQAVALEYKYRPWETVELSNVSLVPGRRTSVSVRTVGSR